MDLAAPLAEHAPGQPASLAAFRDRHRGETIIVCGCGRSLNDLPHPVPCVSIGVNDVGRRFDPTYLVVVNPPQQFSGDRFRYVAQSRASFLFTQRDDLGMVRPGIVRFRLGRLGGTDFADDEVLHYAQNSPYVALCLAAHMGAARIGLIGVDFTEHHFFQPPVCIHWQGNWRRSTGNLRRWGMKRCRCTSASRAILSAHSGLTAFPKLPPRGFP